MGKKYYSYVVSVYRFMQICGLECDKKENVLLSHKIMMRKLSLRHSKMPDKCLLPRRACRENVKNDLIKTGAIVLVEDVMVRNFLITHRAKTLLCLKFRKKN